MYECLLCFKTIIKSAHGSKLLKLYWVYLITPTERQGFFLSKDSTYVSKPTHKDPEPIFREHWRKLKNVEEPYGMRNQ